MDVREKLVKLQLQADIADNVSENTTQHREFTADFMMANGVTVQEWISVKDRLPEQGQAVIVYSGGVLKPTVFAYQFWNKNHESWARITHWMPLPDAPKGE